MAVHGNYIAGEWQDGSAVNADINPSNTRDVVGEYARADRAAALRAIEAARAAAPAWQALTPAGALRHPRPGRHGDPRAQGRARAGCSRARRARRSPRASARRSAPGASSSTSPARRSGSRGEQLPLGAAGRRGRDHARAGGRRRRHHAVELPDRDPGLEDRAGARLRQLRRVQARRARARAAAGRSPTSSRGPGMPPGVFNLVMGAGSQVGRRARPVADGRAAITLHRLGGDGPQASLRNAAARGAQACSSRWAARIRSSSWTTPTSTSRSSCAVQRRLLLDRPALHRVEPPRRAPTASTTAFVDGDRPRRCGR